MTYPDRTTSALQPRLFQRLRLHFIRTQFTLPVVLILSAASCTRPDAPGALDPLSAAEMDSTTATLRREKLLDDSVSVLGLALRESSKDAPASLSRIAEVQLFDQRTQRVTDVVVDVNAARIVSTQERVGAIPPFTHLDGRVAQQLVESDARWNGALSRRGLSAADVYVLRMGPGTLDPRWATAGHRYLRTTATRRKSVSPYTAPVEGLTAIVDLTDRRVVDVIDAEPAPVPTDSLSTLYPATSKAQPVSWALTKPSYSIEGHSVKWLGWHLRLSMHPREGLVLHDVHFAPGGGQPVSVLARASLAEMLVPYGDATPSWNFRSVFDVGEFGIGSNSASLLSGQDVPGGATLLDVVLANQRGAPVTYPNAIGIYERDGGLRWRHQDRAERARELVVRSATTVGNYDYGFSWVFSADGVIAMEIDLTGMMQVKGVHHTDPKFGVAVSPHLSAIHHQHFFSFRLDFDVAGRNNRVREVEVVPMPMDSINPFGTGFEWKSATLASESLAVRDAAPARSRFWVIESATANAAGVHPAYTLAPVPMPDLLTAPDAPLRRRGTFATHQFWVSRYDSAERYPAGEFPGQDSGASGLPTFISDNASVDGTDVVVWYTAGMTHVPRPEEWPIMPVSRMRFELRPSNFVRTAR